MKVIFLTNILPFSCRSGGEICSFRLIRELSARCDDVLVLGRGEAEGLEGKSSVRAASIGRVPLDVSRLSMLEKMKVMMKSCFGGQPTTLFRLSDGCDEAMKSLVGDICFDILFVDHLQMWGLAHHIRCRKKVLVAHNIEHSIYEELRESAGFPERIAFSWEAETLRRLERRVLREISAVICLTKQDAGHVIGERDRMALDFTTHVLPGYALQEPLELRPKSDGLVRIGLLGTWTWESNRRGLDWFLSCVYPRLAGQVEVLVAGKGLEGVAVPSGMKYLGFVESPRAFYELCDVVAVPARAGGGVQEKMIELIGYGVPVVATSVACRGIEDIPGYVRVSDSADGFASLCLTRCELDVETVRRSAALWTQTRRNIYGEVLKGVLDHCGNV